MLHNWKSIFYISWEVQLVGGEIIGISYPGSISLGLFSCSFPLLLCVGQHALKGVIFFFDKRKG